MSSAYILEKAYQRLLRHYGGLDELVRYVRTREIAVELLDGEFEPASYVIRLNAAGGLSVHKDGHLLARSLPMTWRPVADLSVELAK